MLFAAFMFLALAIVAGVFGFGGIAVIATSIAKILFFIFIIGFLISIVVHFFRRR